MKNKAIAIAILVFLLSSCTPKHQYQTREGKAKNKHYNDIQYGKNKSWGK